MCSGQKSSDIMPSFSASICATENRAAFVPKRLVCKIRQLDAWDANATLVTVPLDVDGGALRWNSAEVVDSSSNLSGPTQLFGFRCSRRRSFRSVSKALGAGVFEGSFDGRTPPVFEGSFGGSCTPPVGRVQLEVVPAVRKAFSFSPQTYSPVCRVSNGVVFFDGVVSEN